MRIRSDINHVQQLRSDRVIDNVVQRVRAGPVEIEQVQPVFTTERAIGFGEGPMCLPDVVANKHLMTVAITNDARQFESRSRIGQTEVIPAARHVGGQMHRAIRQSHGTIGRDVGPFIHDGNSAIAEVQRVGHDFRIGDVIR